MWYTINQTNEGEIYKCPHCGRVLDSFSANCPACGSEIRGVKSSNSISEFALRLEQAESEDQKVTIIRNFPIPNSKEDVFEFMILASTNINGEQNQELFNAWLVKFEQCYQKAKLLFRGDGDFDKIQNIYDETNKLISKERVTHGANKVGNTISRIFAKFPNPIFGIVAILLFIYEIVRLIKGDFAPIDIIFAAIILTCTYKITNRKGKK